MAEINIDMKKVRNANYNLPSVISSLSVQKRDINMMKWRIPSEIQNRRNIQGRLNSILREIEKVEQQLTDVYNVTGSAIAQYMNMEAGLITNASKFQ